MTRSMTTSPAGSAPNAATTSPTNATAPATGHPTTSTPTTEPTEEQERAKIRDVPATCKCDWMWLATEHRWSLRKLTRGCPRHWEDQ